MSLQTYSYSYGSEIAEIISRIVSDFSDSKENLRFVIPSRNDKYLWPEHVFNSTEHLWTWQEVYEDAVNSNRNRSNNNARRVLSPPDHLLILKSKLNTALEDHAEKVKTLPGLERSGFLSILSEDIRELLNEAVKPEQLINNPESDNPSEFLLHEIYSDYLEYLESNNLLDSAQVYTAAYDEILKNQDWGRDLIIIFTGFLSFNHGQLQLVQAINDRCRDTIIIKPEANIKGFHDASLQLGINTDEKKSSGNIIEISPAEPGLEPEIIARLLALWSSGNFQGQKDEEFPGFDAVGLMIDEGREDAFSEAFSRYGVPFCFSEGITINNTLPGKILTSLRYLRTKNFPAYDTAMLLTQPCFAGSKFPVLKAYRYGANGLEDWKKYLSKNQDDDVFSSALSAITAIEKFCNAMNGGGKSDKNTPAKIMKDFDDFLNAEGLWLNRYDDISDFPELDENRRLTASAIQTVSEKVLTLSELIPDLGSIKDESLTGDYAFDFLEDWCRNSHVRAQMKISGAVRIFTGQPPVLSTFPVWIMSGVTQKTWSQNMKSSPLLGNEEREKLRENNAYLPRTKEKAEQREALFRRLIQTGERLTIISRPLLDDKGRPVSESPFMQKFLADMTEWNFKRLDSYGRNILLGSDGYIFPEVDADEKKLSRYVPSVEAKAYSVGASDIQELLECPFLWHQKRQSKLYQPDFEIAPPAEFGRMLHKFWENVWKIYRADMNLSGEYFINAAKLEWKKLIDPNNDNGYAEFSKLRSDHRFGRRIESIKFRVDRLTLVQSEIIDKLHEYYYHEKILLEDEAQMMLKLDGITFLGQCDRIEILRGHDGKCTAFIADYKEGRKSSESYDAGMKNIIGKSWNFEKLERFNHGLQLSLYAAMFSKIYDCSLSGVYILGHEDGKISGTFRSGVSGIFAGYFPDGNNGSRNTDIDSRFKEGEYAARCAVKILKDEKFAPDYGSDSCRFCYIKSLCRKGELKGG